MKKVVLSLLISIFLPVTASTANPFMGDYENQISFSFSQGVNSGFLIPPPTQPVPFYLLNIQYSQPTTFFRMPARQSINIGQTLGFGHRYGWDWRDFTIPMIYISEDIALACYKDWYFAAGAGVGLQGQQNERLGAKLLFQFKLTAGYNINEQTSVEGFIQHFSNANTAEANHSYGFYGFGLTYSF